MNPFQPRPNKFALFVYTIAIAFIIAFIESFVGKMMWNWFVPSVFASAPVMTTSHALGLSLVIPCFYPGVVFAHTISGYNDGLEKIAEKLVYAAVALGIGFLVHLFLF